MKKPPAQQKPSAISHQPSAKKTESRKLTSESSERGFTALTFITVLGLFLAIILALVGTGTIKLPGNTGIPVSPIPVSDPVEDDQSCNDPYNADCEEIGNNPEDLTPAQIQKLLEE